MSEWEVDIERVPADDIEQVRVVEQSLADKKFEYHLEDMKVTIPQEMHDRYEAALNPDIPFRVRWRNFILAENKLGRTFGRVKDFALLFAPKWFRLGYGTVDDFIINLIRGDMSTDKTEAKSTSKTVAVFFTLFLISLLSYLGIDIGIEASADAELVGIISGILGIALRAITKQPLKIGETLEDLFTAKE